MGVDIESIEQLNRPVKQSQQVSMCRMRLQEGRKNIEPKLV